MFLFGSELNSGLPENQTLRMRNLWQHRRVCTACRITVMFLFIS